MAKTAEYVDVLPNAAVFDTARAQLKEAQSFVQKQFYSEHEADRAYRLGQLSEALDMAEHAVFNVLNNASNMLDSEAAHEALRAHSARHDEKMRESRRAARA